MQILRIGGTRGTSLIKRRFFHNLSPLSPILLDYYSHHANHRALISDEPMLCTTILTISSRYHVLAGEGGRLRSDDIHRKFWLYWKTLFMRVMYAQDTESKPKTRALGTIESFLLMTEWHPRALHFPPDVDGWDCEMLDTSEDEESGDGRSENSRFSSSIPVEFLSEVVSKLSEHKLTESRTEAAN